MKKIKEVVIVKGVDIVRFQNELNRYLELGYSLRGNLKPVIVTISGPIGTNICYHQMVVKFHDESGS